MGVVVVKNEGILGLYNGLTASVLRQVSQRLAISYWMGELSFNLQINANFVSLYYN
jgi:hypothetical protein